MKHYLSHYTSIYPGVFLKNSIVEFGEPGNILAIFPYEKEIEKTEFYSGLLVFVPEDMSFDEKK